MVRAEPRFPKAQADPWDKTRESEAVLHDMGSRCLKTSSTCRTAPVAAGSTQAGQSLNWGGLQAVPCHGESKARSTMAAGGVHPEQQCWPHDVSVALEPSVTTFGKPATKACSDYNFVFCSEKKLVQKKRICFCFATTFSVVSVTETCSFSGIRLPVSVLLQLWYTLPVVHHL